MGSLINTEKGYIMTTKHIFKGITLAALVSLSTPLLSADFAQYLQMPDKFNDAVSLDKDGNIYVSHSGKFSRKGLTGKTVSKISRNGNISVIANDLSGPLGHDFDSRNNMYIANYNNGSITKLTPDGKQSTFAKLGKAGMVSGIVINQSDEMYVSSFLSGSIFKLDMNGESSLWLKDKRFSGPVGIVMDEKNNIYIGNYNNGRIFKIDANKSVTELPSSPDNSGYITYSDGHIYSTGIKSHKIYKVPVSGGKATEVENTSDVSIKFPNGITINNDGTKLIVSNYLNNKLVTIENFDKQAM